MQAGADVKAVQRMLRHAAARADYLRTAAPNDDVLPFALGGRNAS